MDKWLPIFLASASLSFLSGCVTENYSKSDTPVVQNEATNNEIAMTRISLGLGYLKMGNTTQAKLNLEKAKRFAPKLVQTHTAFAHYYETVGETELAITSYKTALSLKPDDADTLNNFGVFLCRQDRIDEAEKQFLKAIAVPTYLLVSQSYENLAMCQLKAEAFDKTEQYLDKSIMHNPSNASSLLEMARLQYVKANYQAAKNYVKRYEKATRRFTADALALAFKIHQKQREQKIAQNYAAMLVKMFPNAFESKQYLLNGLAEIDADKLADSYRSKELGKHVEKKRIVKLSPNQPVVEQATEPKVAVNTDKVTEQSYVAKGVEKPVTQPQPEAIQSQDTPAASPINTESNPETPKVANSTNITADASDTELKVMTLPVHVVAKGESLYAISLQYNIKLSVLKRWNSLSSRSILRPGDVIYLTDPKKAIAN